MKEMAENAQVKCKFSQAKIEAMPVEAGDRNQESSEVQEIGSPA
jgi:hypothetical protein